MELEFQQAIGLGALLVIVLRLGWIVHGRSVARQKIHGGAISQACNFLSGACFVAILPTVLMIVLVLHPAPVVLAGIVWSPLLLAVLGLALGSLVFALLHALAERAPLQRAQAQIDAHEALGWTEQDAKTSGL